jgi:hypothetical protein
LREESGTLLIPTSITTHPGFNQEACVFEYQGENKVKDKVKEKEKEKEKIC